MNIKTNSTPTTEPILPVAIVSAPSPAPTVLSSITSNGAGKAPERKRTAKSFALCNVKFPEICPRPPGIGSRIVGADKTLSSKTIAKRSLTCSVVNFAKRRAPDASNSVVTTGILF